MAFRVNGNEVISNDGSLGKQSIAAARDGSSTDLTPTDELAIYDGDGGDAIMNMSVGAIINVTVIGSDGTRDTRHVAARELLDRTTTSARRGESGSCI